MKIKSCINSMLCGKFSSLIYGNPIIINTSIKLNKSLSLSLLFSIRNFLLFICNCIKICKKKSIIYPFPSLANLINLAITYIFPNIFLLLKNNSAFNKSVL